jgi:transcriptional regulator GlxA family with amidase domain
MKKRLIVIVAMPNGIALDTTGPADVFASTNQLMAARDAELSANPYELCIASPTEDLQVITVSGLVITCQISILHVTAPIDTLLIGGHSFDRTGRTYPAFVAWLAAHAPQIRRICSVCIGAFVLADAGLLRSRRATTHWLSCNELQRVSTTSQVDPQAIFVKDGPIYTSAGASAGIDLALALVEEDVGRDISLYIARILVLYLRRPGNQAQFSSLLSQQTASKKPIRDLQQWIGGHLKGDLSVLALADRTAMSHRNFARVFAAETGQTPAKYVEKLRLESSKRYLEETTFSLDEIARECGFGSADTMRLSYLRHLHTTPHDYRQLFGTK